jgi:hypothetical protein
MHGSSLRPTVVRIQYRFRLVDIEWNNVTHVEVNFSVDECLEMLRRAPNIVDCKLIIDVMIMMDESPPTYPFPDHRIVHPNLKSLSASVLGSAPLLFRHLSFPSLCELRYDCLPTPMRHDEEFLAFLTRSSSYLRILYLDALEMQHSTLMQILRTTKALTDLDLGSYIPVHDYLFQLLADSSLVADNDNAPLLPGLRCFKYRCTNFISWDLLPKIFGPLSEIGSSHRRPLSKFSLSYLPSSVKNAEANIDEITVLQILELQHRGIQLEVSCGEEDMLRASLKAHKLLPA